MCSTSSLNDFQWSRDPLRSSLVRKPIKLNKTKYSESILLSAAWIFCFYFALLVCLLVCVCMYACIHLFGRVSQSPGYYKTLCIPRWLQSSDLPSSISWVLEHQVYVATLNVSFYFEKDAFHSFLFHSIVNCSSNIIIFILISPYILCRKIINCIQLLFLDLLSFPSQIKTFYNLLLPKSPFRCHSCDRQKIFAFQSCDCARSSWFSNWSCSRFICRSAESLEHSQPCKRGCKQELDSPGSY